MPVLKLDFICNQTILVFWKAVHLFDPCDFCLLQPHYLLDIYLSCKTAGFGLGNRTCSVTRRLQEASQVALLSDLQGGAALGEQLVSIKWEGFGC